MQHRLDHLGRVGCEDVIQRRAGLVLLLVDELAAYAAPIGQRTEPPRVLWRLQLLPEWSHEQQAKQVFPGSPRARSAPGTRAT